MEFKLHRFRYIFNYVKDSYALIERIVPKELITNPRQIALHYEVSSRRWEFYYGAYVPIWTRSGIEIFNHAYWKGKLVVSNH